MRVIQEDPCARALILYLCLVGLPYVLPFFDRRQLELYSAFDFLLLIPAVLFALQYRLGALPSRQERRFWSLLTVAHVFWGVAALLEHLDAAGRIELAVFVATDGLSGLFYVAVLVAITLRPHRETGSGDLAARRYELAELAILALGLFVYLVMIPALLETPAYLTGIPTLILFAALDMTLASRFLQVAALCGSARWRYLYGSLAMTFFLWGLLDAYNVLAIADRLPLASGSRWMVLWHLPFFVSVFAARLRHLPPGGRDQPALEEPSVGALASPSGSPVPLALFSLPALHLLFALMGFLNEATRPARELTIVLCLAALAGLMIAERRSIRRETHEQTTLLSSLIESSPLPIALLDADARVITCNPAFESLFVYSRAELVGQKLEDFINTDETRPEALDNARAVLRGETIQRVTRRTRRDGSVVDVRLYGIPLAVDGRLVGAFGIYQDISGRKRAQQQLKDSEERFRRLAEATFEGILISVDGKIVDANEQLARIFGFPLAEVLGSPVGARVAAEEKGVVRERTRTGYERPYEVDAFRKGGARIRIEVQGKQMPYKGRVARVAAVRDVTERRLLEEQLRQSQKMEAVGRLASGIAHDFNNLLTVITGRSLLLVDQLPAGSQERRDAEEIVHAAERATDLTGQLLTFGRRQTPKSRVLDLNELACDFQKMLDRVLRKNIELVIEPASGPARVEADPVQLEQVLLNLVINGQDAMPDGGRLTVEVVGAGDDGLRAAMGLPPGEYVTLAVHDRGVGMDEETRARVFEPFFTTKEKGKGTGLGLATVYGIVQQAGGGISVASRPGEGTVFRVLLPRLADEPEPVSGRAPP